MREIRLYCSQELISGTTVELDAQTAKHAVQVLRLKTADAITLFNGDGLNYPATLQVAGKRALATLSEAKPNSCESGIAITLVQGISRSEKMDFTLQKATELGITQVQPLFCRRSIVNLKGARLEKKLKHWESVIQSACEQSGRSKLPILLQPKDLTVYCQSLSSDDHKTRIMLDPTSNTSFSELNSGSQSFELLIGPEGGFEDSEIAAAQVAGYSPVSLGPRILRTETAGLASIAILQSLYGDLN